ncbi:MAG: Fic family protein [Lactobacillaceae bacterium]|jgi:hypothetical protein|nr:Fic family protein [Lactobacillaceae bacterium]
MNYQKFAEFLTTLGSLNGYASTVADTRLALETNNAKLLTKGENDAIIFQDALAGIAEIKQIGFSVDGIIAINKAFKSGGDEQPIIPGHLRNAMYNTDDNVHIILDEITQAAYLAPEVVTKNDLQAIVNGWDASPKLGADAWLIFAKIAKLQPFQDGNKRTALIAANMAFGAFETDNYLLIPSVTSMRYRFTADLMDYYGATNTEQEMASFKSMISWTNQEQLTSNKLTETFEERQFNAKTQEF